jgi:hypothetical protein
MSSTLSGNQLTVASIDNATGVSIEYNGSEKLATTATGVDVTGVITTDGLTTSADINFGDNDKAVFGAGSDLQIYHDGSNSYVKDTGTGYLIIGQSNTGVSIQDGGGNALLQTDSDKATLYHNGSPKLAPTSTGVDVTGTVTADGLTVDGASPAVATFNSTSNGVRVEFNGASTPASRPWELGVLNNADGDFQIYQAADAGAGDIKFYTDGTLRQNIDAQTGDISFYEDTGTTAKFFWDASAESLGIGTSSPIKKLDILDSSATSTTPFANQIFQLRSNGSGADATIQFTDSVTYNSYFGAGGGSFYWNTSGTERMRIDSSGNLLVGTTTTDAATTSSVSGLGVNISGDGPIGVASYQASGLILNRLSTDGNILQFRKNGNTVGSIGVHTNKLEITPTYGATDSNVIAIGSSHASGSAGFYTFDSANCIIPYKSVDHSLPDGIQSLGHPTYRWKDLYLSGGVYLGGTGSANHLDDYEEGTWTPTPVGWSTAPTDIEGRYTKVGDLVTLHISGIGGSCVTAGGYFTGGPFVSTYASQQGTGVYVNGSVTNLGSALYATSGLYFSGSSLAGGWRMSLTFKAS